MRDCGLERASYVGLLLPHVRLQLNDGFWRLDSFNGMAMQVVPGSSLMLTKWQFAFDHLNQNPFVLAL